MENVKNMNAVTCTSRTHVKIQTQRTIWIINWNDNHSQVYHCYARTFASASRLSFAWSIDNGTSYHSPPTKSLRLSSARRRAVLSLLKHVAAASSAAVVSSPFFSSSSTVLLVLITHLPSVTGSGANAMLPRCKIAARVRNTLLCKVKTVSTQRCLQKLRIHRSIKSLCQHFACFHGALVCTNALIGSSTNQNKIATDNERMNKCKKEVQSQLMSHKIPHVWFS